ncbi:hypothetical protein ACFYOT_26365 [Saccharothrix saharensis]|uniref:hypothetical protein n=1 Tax=Saccharothrix saharensis TaxID=571190 RepID=UPI0036871B98
MSIRHDVRTRMFLGGGWQDVTDHVFSRDPIEIERGRPDESTVTPPQTCSLTLDNRSGDYSTRNPMGTWYGSIGRNTPIEVGYRLGTDTFTRTLSNSWGTSDSGLVWGGSISLGGTIAFTDYSVGGGKGLHSVPAVSAYRSSQITNFSQRDVDVAVTVTTSFTNVTGGDIEPANIMLRGQNSSTYYMARVVVTSTEAVTVTFHHASAGQLATPVTVFGLAYSSAGLRVRAQAEGHTLRAKVWAANALEPYGWDITVHDERITSAGEVGIRSGVASGNTNTKPIVFSYDDLVITSPRFAGEVANFPTGSDVSNRDRYARIEAAGIMRRLGQGKAPLLSALRRHVQSLEGVDAPVNYWPLEDAHRAVAEEVLAVIGSGTLAFFQNVANAGAIKWASDTELPGSLQAPGLTEGGRLEANVDPSPFATGWTVAWAQKINGESGAQTFFYTASGAFTVSLITYTDGTIECYLTETNPLSPTLLFTYVLPAGTFDQVWHTYAMLVNQVGANVEFYLDVDGVIRGAATKFGATMSGLRQAQFVTPSGTTEANHVGHVAVWGPSTSPGENFHGAAFGWQGEIAGRRMERLCAENGIDFSHVGDLDATPPMGAQRAATLLELLRDCAEVDMGTLYEPRGAIGLAYRTLASTYAQDPVLTLDCSANQLAHPFQPVEDDKLPRNDITAKRVDGGEYRMALETGRMSVQPPPEGIGRYDDTYTANIESDSQLPDIAAWQLALGTVDEPRYPNLRVDLDAPDASDLLHEVLDLDVDDRLVITDASAVGIYDDISQLARGYRESLGNHRFLFAVNASPASPYDVVVLDDADSRLDADGSTTEDLTTTETAVDVTTAGNALWSTTEEPYDVVVGGEVMTVTNVTGTTSPQTLDVTRSVNGVVKTHSAGSVIAVRRPVHLGL